MLAHVLVNWAFKLADASVVAPLQYTQLCMTEARIIPADAYLPITPALQRNIWRGGAEALRVVNIIDEAPDVKTFTFQPDTPALFNYKAGQFVTLDLPAPSGSLLRTYTISSAPSRPMTISVTVKAQPASVGTRWMFENLVPGSLLNVLGPAGHFTLELAKRNWLLFISAGSGITPMMSMLSWLADVAPDTDVAFLHCARSPDDIIFRGELNVIAPSMKNLKLGFIVEQRGHANTCEMGLCGTCKVMKLSRDVVMEHNGGITDEEIEEGYVLACCSAHVTGRDRSLKRADFQRR